MFKNITEAYEAGQASAQPWDVLVPGCYRHLPQRDALAARLGDLLDAGEGIKAGFIAGYLNREESSGA